MRKSALSIFLKKVKENVKEQDDLLDILNHSKRLIQNAEDNLNKNYRLGLVPRFHYTGFMGAIEDIFEKIENLSHCDLLEDYDENMDELIHIVKKREEIIFSNGLKNLTEVFDYIYEVYIENSYDLFEEYSEKLSFFNEHVEVLSMSIENRNIMEPLFLDTKVVGQGPFHDLSTIYLLLPLQSQKALQLRIHLRSDNSYNIKRHPYFAEKMKMVENACNTCSDNKEHIRAFIFDYLTNKHFLIKNVTQIRIECYNSLRVFKEAKENHYTKLFEIYKPKSIIEKKNFLNTLLLYSTKEDNQLHNASIIYDKFHSIGAELSNYTPLLIEIWDLFPWKSQKLLNAAKQQVFESLNVVNDDIEDDLSYEQKIEMMKVTKKIKTKAYAKLKEMAGRHSDTATKASNWLDGLLRIPFGFYKKELFIKKFQDFKDQLENLHNQQYQNMNNQNIRNSLMSPKTPKTLSKETVFYYDMKVFFEYVEKLYYMCNTNTLQNILQKRNVKMLREMLKELQPNRVLKKRDLLKKNLVRFVSSSIVESKNPIELLTRYFADNIAKPKMKLNLNILNHASINQLQKDWHDLQLVQKNFMTNMRQTLDKSIYAHNNAKQQIERIVSQWATGKSSGYVLGFEGPPGVGKTTLAKYGLAKALRDKDGKSRPFHFIAVGGSCNGSTLEGHSYTYMGSQWGSIVNVLMDSQCMNPIIFFDELDKVSHSSQGREIIGILTHLTDSTQNTNFQDKYFAGIDLDLSKALIIFSYNDANNIDPILLDRIHRIKFKELNLTDKLVVIHDYLIPSICNEIGLSRDMIQWESELIKFVIENYTAEPGVRKIKQILYDIYREINLLMLNDKIGEYPFVITKEILTEDILKKYPRIHPVAIKNESYIGTINGMYATSAGYGGILPIESKWVCDSTPFKLHLTGSLKNVMQESMSIAKNLALELMSEKERNDLVKHITKKTNLMKGIHIHCPEGAVPKDGPSAGMAITLCIYSLLCNKLIPDNYSFTGEIRLSGEVLRVGGIASKVQGALRAGVTNVVLPEENRKDYELFIEESSNVKEHQIYFVSNIHEAMDILWE